MGLESYNFKIEKKKEIAQEVFIVSLLDIGYNKTNEKTYERYIDNGVIEIEVNHSVSLRTAKPNNPRVINDIFMDLKQINNTFPLSIYDYQLKANFSVNDSDVVQKNFIKKRKEFAEYYPGIKYPIRCEEVVDQIRSLLE